MAYAARVLQDSVNPDGNRLTTCEVTLPRIVLAEFNTHCMFARNSASSRAIPVKKTLERVMTDPFIPIWWGKNEKGMQASEELDLPGRCQAKERWLEARDRAVRSVLDLQLLDVHKQIANRLLEPFMWHTIIATGMDHAWANFFHLRRSKYAQPEIKHGADLLWDVYHVSKPNELDWAEPHNPLIFPEDTQLIKDYCARNEKWLPEDVAQQVSAARCARVSYLTHDGKRDISEDIQLFERLISGGHWSPLEHTAVAAGGDSGKYNGFISLRHTYENEYVMEYHG
jgi:thymidylate synthase ThyX